MLHRDGPIHQCEGDLIFCSFGHGGDVVQVTSPQSVHTHGCGFDLPDCRVSIWVPSIAVSTLRRSGGPVAAYKKFPIPSYSSRL